MTDLRSAVVETWEAALEDDRVIAAYPDLVRDEAERSVRRDIIRMLKDIARAETEEGAQLSLFGFPAVIAVPVPDDGYVYLRATKATWGDLAAGAQVHELNVRRAQQRLDAYNDALETVRPVMEGTDRTLAEAVAELQPTAA